MTRRMTVISSILVSAMLPVASQSADIPWLVSTQVVDYRQLNQIFSNLNLEASAWPAVSNEITSAALAWPAVSNSVMPGVCPVGTVLLYAGTNAPAGWHLCNGGWYAPADYPELFARIGYSFGRLEDYFSIPNTAGRFPLGVEIGGIEERNNVGDRSGSDTITLQSNNIPPHVHQQEETFNIGDEHIAVSTLPEGGEEIWSMGTWTTKSAGEGRPFTNMPPYIVFNFIIRMK